MDAYFVETWRRGNFAESAGLRNGHLGAPALSLWVLGGRLCRFHGVRGFAGRSRFRGVRSSAGVGVRRLFASDVTNREVGGKPAWVVNLSWVVRAPVSWQVGVYSLGTTLLVMGIG